jgi:ABC-2 type transport system ATP-binding protein
MEHRKSHGQSRPGDVHFTALQPMEFAIETHQLTRVFDQFVAVDAIDVRVKPGQFYGFLGPNGAGKSTTIKMLTGLLASSGGTMRLLGADLADAKAAREVKRRIGVIPENLALFENLTAREYLTFIGRMYGVPADVVRQRSQELLEVMDLASAETKLTVEYSHGMKKKLSLAAALLPKPELLFLDEPFEGVDAVASRQIKDVLKRFVDHGSTVFLTSHVMEIVERLCTQVGIIVKGKLVFQDSMENLRAAGGSLEDRFIELVGSDHVEAQKLNWLEGAA